MHKGQAILNLLANKKASLLKNVRLFGIAARCSVFASLLILVSASVLAKNTDVILFNIPQQQVDTALIYFAEQVDLTLIVPFNEVDGKLANRLIGKYSIKEALDLLLMGTGLQAEIVNKGQRLIIVSNLYPEENTKFVEQKLDSDGQKCITEKPKDEGILESFVSVIGSNCVQQQQNEKNEEVAQTKLSAIEKNTGVKLEEVLVTAQKRAQNLQVVPISVSAFTDEGLENRGLSNVSQIADFAPNVTLNTTSPFSGASSSLVAFIRGVGQTDFQLNYDPGVGLYVDGVYYARPVGSVIDLLDVERIEVLKGPQGTLFGRNTIGGAISVVTKMPDREFNGKVEVTMGDLNRLDVRGAINFPFVKDKVLASLAFSRKNRDGYQKRIAFPGVRHNQFTDQDFLLNTRIEQFPDTGKQGNENNTSVRGKLHWIISDAVQATFGIDYSRTRENAPASSLLTTFPAPYNEVYNDCLSGVLPLSVCGHLHNVNADTDPNNDHLFWDANGQSSVFVTDDIDTTYATGPGYSEIDSKGITATIDWQLVDNIALKSISAYRQLDAAIAPDADGSPLHFNQPAFNIPQQQVTQELQLSGTSFNKQLTWLAGLYYFQERGVVETPALFVEGLFQFYSNSPNKNTSYAAFGQATYQINNKIGLTIGLRYTNEEKMVDPYILDLNDISNKLAAVGVFPAQPDPSNGVDSRLLMPTDRIIRRFNNTSPRFVLDYHFSDDVYGFIGYSEGYKAGGVDLRPTQPIAEAKLYNEETAETFEIGFKSSWLNKRLRVNGTLFKNTYTDFQLAVQDVTAPISPVTRNVGEVEVKGLELDFETIITDNLRLTGALGYQDAVLTQVNDGILELSIDNKLQNTPKTSVSLGLDYKQLLSNAGEIHYHANLAFVDDVFNNPENTEEIHQPSRNVANIAVSYITPAANWEFVAGLQNVTNERYITSGYRMPGIGFVEANFSPPRQWYVTSRYKF